MENNNYIQNVEARTREGIGVRTNTMIRKVYLWMFLALVVSGLTAYYVASTPSILEAIFMNSWAVWALLIGEIVLVVALNAAINKINAVAATLMFLLYSVINGVTLSFIFIVYSGQTIATTFFVTAGTYAAMAVYGSVTRKDLTKMGSIAMMALIGLIIASVVNIFLKSNTMGFIISIIGVLLFVGLTAYDAQKIKAAFEGVEESDTASKYAVLGALTLYLDFINLFLFLLRIFGGGRD